MTVNFNAVTHEANARASLHLDTAGRSSQKPAPETDMNIEDVANFSECVGVAGPAAGRITFVAGTGARH